MDPEIVFIHGEGHFAIPRLLQSHLALTGWAAYCSATLSPATRVGCPAGPSRELWGRAAHVGCLFPGSPCRSLVGAKPVTCAKTLR